MLPVLEKTDLSRRSFMKGAATAAAAGAGMVALGKATAVTAAQAAEASTALAGAAQGANEAVRGLGEAMQSLPVEAMNHDAVCVTSCVSTMDFPSDPIVLTQHDPRKRIDWGEWELRKRER
jgi:secreted PhoX family phosphatase